MKRLRHRITEPKKIRSAKTKDDAIEIAWFGRVLSELERSANLYLFFSQPATYDNQAREESANDLLGFFLDAIDKRDGNSLRNLASFVDHWPYPSADRIRQTALELGNKVSARQLAKLVGYKGYDLSPIYRVLREIRRLTR